MKIPRRGPATNLRSGGAHQDKRRQLEIEQIETETDEEVLDFESPAKDAEPDFTWF